MILEETGYARYAAAMPNGTKKKANIEMLLEKAAAYEKTSYRGLFHSALTALPPLFYKELRRGCEALDQYILTPPLNPDG